MKLGGLQQQSLQLLHGPPTFVLKYAQDVIFIYLVLQHNVNMAEFWIQTSYYFFILETTEHFLKWGTGMLNSSWIPYISNQSNPMLQNQTAVIQFKFVSIKVAFIILSPSAIEASHSWLMRQFELYAIITQLIALMSVAACQASGRLCLFT